MTFAEKRGQSLFGPYGVGKFVSLYDTGGRLKKLKSLVDGLRVYDNRGNLLGTYAGGDPPFEIGASKIFPLKAGQSLPEIPDGNS